MDTAMLVGSFIPIVAILLGGLILLVPIAGLTARFALKPVVEAFVKLRTSQVQEQSAGVLERRLSLVEQQLHLIETSLRRLEEGADFQQQLAAGSMPRARAAEAGDVHAAPAYERQR